MSVPVSITRVRNRCYFVTIRFSAITVCTVGPRSGHGWPVVITSTRKVKSAFSEGSKNPRFYLPIDAFSILITKAHHTQVAFCAVTASSARRSSEFCRLTSTRQSLRLAAWTSVGFYRRVHARPLSRYKLPRLFEFPIVPKRAFNFILHGHAMRLKESLDGRFG